MNPTNCCVPRGIAALPAHSIDPRAQRPAADVGGFALIAVLVALSILLAMLAPFLLSMGNGEAAAFALVDERQADLGSANVRELLLYQASRTHDVFDTTPHADGLDEFPSQLVVPPALLEASQVRALTAGEVEDLQRRIQLPTSSPLVLANLLGLAAHLADDHPADATELTLTDGASFPERGHVVVDRELIRYGARDGNVLRELTRGLRVDDGFAGGEDHFLHGGSLVLDYRTVLASTFQYENADPENHARLRPWSSIDELARLHDTPYGGFTATESDRLRRFATVAAARETASEFGPAERLFEDAAAGSQELRVRSTQFLGAGGLVRLRTLDGSAVEYALAWSTEIAQAQSSAVVLETRNVLTLMNGLRQSFRAIDSVVEPVLPHPINVNTAAPEVLTAIVANVRQRRSQSRFDNDGRPIPLAPPLSTSQARAIVETIVAMRGTGAGAAEDGVPVAFDSFEDLAKRVFDPLFEGASQQQRQTYGLLYQSLLSPRPGALEMTLAPITFESAPLVAYRAASAQLRGGTTRPAQRIERSGEAWTLPGRGLDFVAATQSDFEEAIRIGRYGAHWMTTPINLWAATPFGRGTSPVSRFHAHMIGRAFPAETLGAPRFPSREGVATIEPAPASALPSGNGWSSDPMFGSLHPEGRDVTQEGPYISENNAAPTGGTGPGMMGGSRRANTPNTSTREFPWTGRGGMPEPFGVQFWFKLRDTGTTALFDLAGELPDRNRVTLQIRDSDLVLEVLDEAGLDPDPLVAQSSPERTAGTWKVPLQDLRLVPEVWYHANLAVRGNQPGQLSLVLDGVPREKVSFRTHLTAPLPTYGRPPAGTLFRDDDDRFVEIRVESTEGFPDRGVLRIGLELFEYSSKDAGVFYCRFVDSLGGRCARMSVFEYRPDIPTDGNGRPILAESSRLADRGDLDFAPAHAAGNAVELYGYAVAVQRDQIVQVGSTSLASALGPFGIARVWTSSNMVDITIVSPPAPPIRLGRGIDETFNGDIELADPLPDPSGASSYRPPPAQQRIQEAFPANGGYALIVQYRIGVDPAQLSGNARGADIGGYELIRYAGRQGARLTGIERGVTLNPTSGRRDQLPGNGLLYDGLPKKYVLSWDRVPIAGNVPPGEYAVMVCYIVPVSFQVSDGSMLIDPSVLQQSEWLQLYPPGDETQTEWVRYDWIERGTHVVRTNNFAWMMLFRQLTSQQRFQRGSAGGQFFDLGVPTLPAQPYPVVQQVGRDYIGYTDQVEVDFPVIQVARRSLNFRGDGFSQTSSHAQPANTRVLPVHRFELDWGNYGALNGRVGRNDRAALVAGSTGNADQRPAVDWHTVNWTAREYYGDEARAAGGQVTIADLPERIGRYPFQLAGFKDPVRAVFIGPPQRDDLRDPRSVDRLVKFPSGEMPAAYVPNARIGGTTTNDARPVRGLVDEVAAVTMLDEILTLDEAMPADAMQFVVRTDLRRTSVGVLGNQGDLTQLLPRGGGLASIDGEIVAWQSTDAGRFTIARQGRGLLTTEPRAHAEGAQVVFLRHVPVAILVDGLTQDASEFQIQSIGELPRFGGTLLAGRELLHYTWSVGAGDGQVLAMPRWQDPADPEAAPKGLFRGRYGTSRQSLEAGAPLIWFPFRYWDRFHERSDDPELACFQLTHATAPVYWRDFAFEAEQVDPLVDLHAFVRVDGLASFADDPRRTPGLWRFEKGRLDDKPLPLGWQGSRVDVRFVTIYKPGAFDPITFVAHSWKRAPAVRGVMLRYEGEGRILSERVTTR